MTFFFFFLKKKLSPVFPFPESVRNKLYHSYSHSQWFLTQLTWLASLHGVGERTCAVTWRAVTSLPSARQGTPLPTGGACPCISLGPALPLGVCFSLRVETSGNKGSLHFGHRHSSCFQEAIACWYGNKFSNRALPHRQLIFSSTKSEHNWGLSFSYLPMCFPAPTYAMRRRDTSSDGAGTD